MKPGCLAVVVLLCGVLVGAMLMNGVPLGETGLFAWFLAGTALGLARVATLMEGEDTPNLYDVAGLGLGGLTFGGLATKWPPDAGEELGTLLLYACSGLTVYFTIYCLQWLVPALMSRRSYRYERSWEPSPQAVPPPRSQERIAPQAKTGRGKTDFPESAPPDAPKVGREFPYEDYSTDEALRAFERSNVNPSKPADSQQAAHLVTYCGWVLKERAGDFIESAARDAALPANVRAFYIHAAQLTHREKQR